MKNKTEVREPREFLALFDSDLWENTSHDLCIDGWPAAVVLINQEVQQAKEAYDELRKELREALGHSNCYCKQCKDISDKYWYPIQSKGEQE